MRHKCAAIYAARRLLEVFVGHLQIMFAGHGQAVAQPDANNVSREPIG